MGQPVKGKHVVIVEDLIDTGATLAWVKEYLLSKGAASVKICCMLDKTSGRKEELKGSKFVVDYVGFECPDEFVVGYGMDFAERYRTLPFIGVLKPSVFAKKVPSDAAE